MIISGKVALVTGAASGIGRTTAKMLALEGLRAVAIADLDQSGLSETAADITSLTNAEALSVVCDVTDQESLEKLYDQISQQYNQLDIVINNAGIVSGPPPFPDTDAERIKLVLEIDLIAVVQSSALAIKLMRENNGGVIVNTASTGGLTPYLADAPYAAAKAGVEGFTRSLAREVASRKVTVHCVAPGFVDTDMTRDLDKDTRDKLLDQVPLRRLGSVEDIAAATLFLVGPGADYITGITLNVNGGMFM